MTADGEAKAAEAVRDHAHADAVLLGRQCSRRDGPSRAGEVQDQLLELQRVLKPMVPEGVGWTAGTLLERAATELLFDYGEDLVSELLGVVVLAHEMAGMLPRDGAPRGTHDHRGFDMLVSGLLRLGLMCGKELMLSWRDEIDKLCGSAIDVLDILKPKLPDDFLPSKAGTLYRAFHRCKREAGLKDATKIQVAQKPSTN